MTQDNSKAQELLPCPFCGNTDIEYDIIVIECRNCHASGPVRRTDGNGGALTSDGQWNTRAPVSQDAAQLVERGLLASLRAFVNEHARGVPFDADRQGTAIILIDEAANEIEALTRVQPSTDQDMGAQREARK